jgi:hypothetical protein
MYCGGREHDENDVCSAKSSTILMTLIVMVMTFILVVIVCDHDGVFDSILIVLIMVVSSMRPWFS